MERRMNAWTKPAGLLAFSGVSFSPPVPAIFAFLAARQAYGSAMLPPMFIIMSFAWGLAVFMDGAAADLSHGTEKT